MDAPVKKRPGDLRLLHVDDELDFAEMAATFLERNDDQFTVETASSASDGLDRLTDTAFDCVISDYDMPGRNGIEFLETVREEYSNLPFILFTGKGSEAVASEAISTGVTDYLQKAGGTEHFALLANRINNAVELTRARRERKRHLNAIETTREGIAIFNDDGELIYVNESFADLYGYDPEEMIGEHWELIYRDEDVSEVHDEILPTLEVNGHWRGETIGLRADGSTFVEDHMLASSDGGEVVCTVQDITEYKDRKQELELKNRAMDEAPVGIVITDPAQDDNPIIYANERFQQLTGYAEDEILGRNCRFLQGEDTDPEPVATMREAVDNQEPVTVELRNYRNDGAEFWTRVSIAPVKNDDGNVTHFVGFQQDVTKWK
jgi:PAS domain S-box-containing protein